MVICLHRLQVEYILERRATEMLPHMLPPPKTPAGVIVDENTFGALRRRAVMGTSSHDKWSL
ncbi:hypothetical protein EMIT0P201_40017 [Pseudomonas chlororaphis]